MNIIQACEILEINTNSNQEEIKKAYKKKALEYHPDKNNSDNAADKFKEVGEAYTFLTNRNNNQPNRNINPHDIFKDIFKNDINIKINNINNINNIFTTFSINGQQNINNNKNNFVSRSSKIQIIDGKKIETIVEESNGNTSKKIIITDLKTGNRTTTQTNIQNNSSSNNIKIHFK
jgi:DnaJ-class molecular chaperone